MYLQDVTFVKQRSESALCIYSGCHCVYVPDVTLASNKNIYCVYIPDAILFICRMSRLLNKSRERALCVYSGCHFVYMPDVTLD